MTLRDAVRLFVLYSAIVVALVALFRPLSVVVISVAIMVVIGWAGRIAYGYWLQWRWERTWGRAGKRILLVYSRSPHWQHYIENNWLPRLQGRVVLLNWSDRAMWRRPLPLEVRSFYYWGGAEDFNPIAIVFPARGRVRAVRFWRAFREFKHGKYGKLRKAEEELFTFASASA